MPATTAQAARINTRKRLRAENSMTRSIMTLAGGRNGHCRTRPQAALRIDQKRARGYDAFTGLEAIENFHAVAPALADPHRSEEHTSELQSLRHLVCRLLLEKKH